jgi:hypothetical protein
MSAFDLPDTYLLRVLCAGPTLLGQLLGVFGLGVSSFWTIAPFAIVGAFINAAWYMIVAEAIRLLLKKLPLR